MKKIPLLTGLTARMRAFRRRLRGRPWWHYGLLALLSLGTVALAGLLVIMVTIVIFLKDLPSPEDLANFQVAQSTRILDSKGALLYELHGNERRIVIPLASMSRVPDAVVAAEDDGFYEHPGFDIKGLVRAGLVYAKKTVTGSGRIEGGSTITQQFVKMTYLSPEKTFSRKAKELFLAMEVEQRFTKQQILEHYLNVAGFGSNAYGVEAAARMYFAKGAKDLTLDESAMLVALLQSPSRLSPYGQRTEHLKARTTYVLTRMRDTNRITKDEFAAATGADTLAKVKPSKEFIKAPHFVFFIRDVLEEKYGKELAEGGGLTVTTTLDPDIQKIAEDKVAGLVRRNGRASKVTNAALVSVDPKTGAIVAMVGSKDYFATDVDGKVNVTTSRRQPGSSWKPIVYANYFRKGFGPGSVLWDTETDFGGGYRPNNFSGKFSGPVTVRRAVGGSLNLPAIKALYIAGIEDTVNLAADAFGFRSVREAPKDSLGLSFAIGSTEVTPLEMAQGYTVFASNGIFRPSVGIQKIVDPTGKVLEELAPERGQQVIDPQVAYQINHMLSDCSSRPAGWGALCYAPKYTVAAKTGTSNRRIGAASYPADFWTLAYSPSIVTAMWAGNNDGSVLNRSSDSLGTVAPIMKEYLNEVFARKGVVREEFPRPDGITDIVQSNLTGLPARGGGVHRDIISDFGKEYLTRFRSDPPVTAEVDESCGPALASPYSPPRYVKTWVYAAVHDPLYFVRPDDPLLPAFERAARAYTYAGSDTSTDAPGSDPGQPAGSVDGSNVVYISSPDRIPTEVCTKYSADSAPRLSLIRPSDGQLRPGENEVAVQVESVNPLTSIAFRFDGEAFAESTACSVCTVILTVPESASGAHTISVVAEDDTGLSSTASFPVTIGAALPSSVPDAPPTVRILEPANGTTVAPGDQVRVEARVRDDGEIALVEFRLNGTPFATRTSSPYRATLTVPAGSTGPQVVTVFARDNAGNVAEDDVSITVVPIPVPTPSTVSEPASSSPAPLAPAGAVLKPSIPR